MKVVKIVVLLICLVKFGETYSQDAVFSQFFNSTLYLNPALAGIEDDMLFSFNHRTQWNALQFPYQTSQVSAIIPYHTSKHAKPFGHVGGLGLSAYTDVAGQNNSFRTTGVNGNFAYNLPIEAHHVNVVSFGLQIGFVQKRVNTEQLTWGSQYNPYIGFDATLPGEDVSELRNKTFMDIGSGVFWWYNPLPEENRFIMSANSGLSVSHMNHPNESMGNRKTRIC